jgi:hypothetical protein
MGAHKMVASSTVAVLSVGGFASDSPSVVTRHFHENSLLGEFTETHILYYFKHLMLKLDYEDAKSKHS